MITREWLKALRLTSSSTHYRNCLQGGLKRSPELWQAFKRLRRARNSLAHEGRTRIDGHDLSVEEATALVQKAQEIVDWWEETLEPRLRRTHLPLGVAFGVTTSLRSNPPEQGA